MEFIDYLLRRINKRLAENFKKVLQTDGTTKAYWLLKRVDLLRLQERTRKTVRRYLLNRSTKIENSICYVHSIAWKRPYIVETR